MSGISAVAEVVVQAIVYPSTGVTTQDRKRRDRLSMQAERIDQRLLSVRGVSKRYAGQTALDGMSFDLGQSELLGLLGPNGAGKTTLIRSLCGRIRIDAGEIEFDGELLNWKRHRNSIGVVPQDLAIYGDLTARENLRLFGRLQGVRPKKLTRAVDEVLDWIDLRDRQHDLVRTFSGGMKRRVNIACSILHRPRLVLLDEPTVGVDPQSREKIFEMIEQLRATGTAFILTTHHLEEAESRCRRVVIVDHGEVIAEGTAASLVQDIIGDETRVSISLEQVPDSQTTSRLMRNVHVTSCDDRTVRAAFSDVAVGLANLLQQLDSEGIPVRDVDVRRPTLQDVFLRLTGRELRE